MPQSCQDRIARRFCGDHLELNEVLIGTPAEDKRYAASDWHTEVICVTIKSVRSRLMCLHIHWNGCCASP
jgi:hypothetical protein